MSKGKRRCAAVLLGAPGSGKTTVARLLAARHGVSVLETGTLLKEEIRRGTPLGQQAKSFVDAGGLVPLDLIQKVLSRELEQTRGDVVLFDGFPRSFEQIDLLFQLLRAHDLELCGVVVLKVDLQTSLNRLSGRRICVNCGTLYNIYSNPPKQADVCDRCGGKLVQRPDDRPEVVRERFKTHEDETIPVIEFFRNNFGRVTWEEPATLPPEQVADQIWRRLEAAARTV